MKNFVIILIAFIVPLLIANIAIYRQATTIVQREAREANINMLWKTSKSIDLVFGQIDQVISQLGMDQEVLNSVIDPSLSNTSRNLSVINKIRNVAISNEYIHSIYVYSAFGESIISSSGEVYPWYKFYDKKWLSSYSSTFLGTHQINTRTMEDKFGKETNSVTLIRNLPFSSWSKVGALVININEDQLYGTIKGMDEYNKGEFLVINNEGRVISYGDKTKLDYNLESYEYIKKILTNEEDYFVEEVDNEKILFSYVKSPYNKWTYIYMIPLSELYNDSSYLFKIIGIITIINIFICLAFAFSISQKIYIPIKRLIDLIDKKSKFTLEGKFQSSINEYDFLDQAYNFVLDKNLNMQNTINNSKPIIKEKLFNNLLTGKGLNVQEIEGRLQFLNIDFTFENFVVIVMQIDDYNEFVTNYDEIKRNLFKLQLIEIIEKLINEKYIGVSIEIESNRLVSIINYGEENVLVNDNNDIVELARKIKNMVEEYFPFTITAGIGMVYKDLFNIKLSYNEALKALRYKIYQGKNKIIDIGTIEEDEGELYYYNSEKERLLLNNIKIGNRDKVQAIIEELFLSIINNRNISTIYIKEYFIRIINQIIESVINSGINLEDIFEKKRNVYDEILEKETISDLENWFKEICLSIVGYINVTNESKGNKNIENVLQYIEKNFNKDISLKDVADYVDLNPSYVSTIFKENIGESFVSYLNKTRIEKAKKLIVNTQHTIKEIGFRVGFNSLQSFFRIFKKYEGITPGQYRQNESKEV
ncbi:helix-turn-helix domain-containing protein [Clostridium sp. DL1XJH146]